MKPFLTEHIPREHILREFTRLRGPFRLWTCPSADQGSCSPSMFVCHRCTEPFGGGGRKGGGGGGVGKSARFAHDFDMSCVAVEGGGRFVCVCVCVYMHRYLDARIEVGGLTLGTWHVTNRLQAVGYNRRVLRILRLVPGGMCVVACGVMCMFFFLVFVEYDCYARVFVYCYVYVYGVYPRLFVYYVCMQGCMFVYGLPCMACLPIAQDDNTQTHTHTHATHEERTTTHTHTHTHTHHTHTHITRTHHTHTHTHTHTHITRACHRRPRDRCRSFQRRPCRRW